MNTIATFEHRVVATASLFLGDQVPAFIIEGFVADIPAEERENVKAYMATTLQTFEAIAPMLTPADFATPRGRLTDCMDLGNQLSEKYADKGVFIGFENLAVREEVGVDVILATYRTAVEHL